ncbi:hypothetical protein V1290_003783 [Bradyrhizobium sp. AZCC 1578]|uniref:hypothetical protein n=1 Tax=Bradyrhizobium sp. AZCC 1578 TaxID=3117027 RepID=UPI002FEE6B9B
MRESGSNFWYLSSRIIELSDAKIWPIAKTEWRLIHVFHSDRPDACLCTHEPIIEICVLKNRHNGNEAWVGNCCVKRFLGLRSDLIFGCVKRVRGDISRALNAATVNFLFKKRVFTKWEYDFLRDTSRKRRLSGRQHDKRVELNRKALAYIEPKRRPVRPVHQRSKREELFAMFG